MSGLRKALLVIPSSIIFFLLVPLVSVYIGGYLDVFLGLQAIQRGGVVIIISAVLIIIGGYYVLESIRILFIQGRGIPLGDLLPEDQTSELITGGIYAQTRNPMVFGYLLCLIALGLILGSASTAFIIPSCFITIWTIWIKTHEEPALEARFGETYREYRQKTPYLVPRPRGSE